MVVRKAENISHWRVTYFQCRSGVEEGDVLLESLFAESAYGYLFELAVGWRASPCIRM